jgi:hypothetical protein
MPKREQLATVANRLAATHQPAKLSTRGALATPLQRAVAHPKLASAHDVINLQQRFGNRAVQRWLASHALQPQLTVGAAGDHYEREADRVAEQVMGRLGDRTPVGASRSPAVQRQPLAATITRFVQRKGLQEDELQRAPKEEEDLRRKPLDDEDLKRAPHPGQVGLAGGPVAGQTGAAIDQARGGGQRLPAGVRRPMEQAFGADFSGVKIHTDQRADRLSRSLSARAFTTGRDVFFRKGEFSPTSRPGQKLLAHELTHVVQQGGGAIRRELADEPRPAAQPAGGEQAPDLRDAQTGKRVDQLQPGDVLLPRGGKELAGDLAQYSSFLHQLWRGQARGANGGFPAAGLALGGTIVAHASGNGVSRAPVQGDHYVFRCRNRALADLAARLATNLSVFHNSVSGLESKYSSVRAFDALAHSSRFNRSRAVTLAAFFLRGASANNLFCADFAIMCYQAAALLEDVEQLKQASPPPAPAAQEDAAGRLKSGLAALPPGALKLDPARVREFQLAAELHRLNSGDSPRWELAGLY